MMVRIYVLNVPEFLPLVDAARLIDHAEVKNGEYYFRIDARDELVFERKAMKMKPAVWYGAFTGGLDGEIVEFGRDTVRVVSTKQ